MTKKELKLPVNVYQIKEDIKYEEVITSLKKNKFKFNKKDIITYDGSVFRLLTKEDPRAKSDWVTTINEMFSKRIKQNPGALNRSIILISTLENLYVAVYGYSKSYIEEMVEPSFGLDFASKAIKDYKIEAKNVDSIQKNTLRSSINYKKDRFELPQANEAYFGIVGTPENIFFGNKINCKEGVSFTKKFDINNNDFYKLFYEIDKTMKLKKGISIPRLEYLKDSSSLSNSFNNELLNELKKTGLSTTDLSINIPYLHVLDENITDENSNIVYRISYRVEETSEFLKESIELNIKDIKEFIVGHKQIKKLEDIKITMYDGKISSDLKIREIKLIRLLLAEFTVNSEVYLLQNGHWGKLNNEFLEIMNQQIKILKEYKSSNNDSLIEFANNSIKYDIYNVNYFSHKSDIYYAGENGYIETIIRKNCPRVKKLHKRLINGNGLKNEIADFYDKQLKEIFAVKMGTSSGDCVYSFEQSIVSIILLKNKVEFKLTEQLSKYNEEENYLSHQILSPTEINDIQNITKSNVLWVIPSKKIKDNEIKDINKKISEKISEETFTIDDIGSFIVKLKLIEWFNICLQHGIVPKLIMVNSEPVEDKIPLIPTDPTFKTEVQGKEYYS